MQRLPHLSKLGTRRQSLQGEPEQINTKGYLAGGRDFGVAVSANITPDGAGKPAGLTLAQFLHVMRTGEDPDRSGRLLQIMPWPLYQWKTDRDLTAIYEYLFLLLVIMFACNI